MGLWYVGTDMCLIICGRPLSVVGGKLIWMPWLGKMPAASTSEGVGDRARGVRSAVAIVRAVRQHWAAGERCEGGRRKARMGERRSRAGIYNIRHGSRSVGLLAVQATTAAAVGLSALQWRWSCRAKACALLRRRVGRSGEARKLASLAATANRQRVCPTTPIKSIYCTARTLVVGSTLSTLCTIALGHTEPPADRHLHAKPVCPLHHHNHVGLLLLHIRPPQ